MAGSVSGAVRRLTPPAPSCDCGRRGLSTLVRLGVSVYGLYLFDKGTSLILRSFYQDNTNTLKHFRPLHNKDTHNLTKRFIKFRHTNNIRLVDQIVTYVLEQKTSQPPVPIVKMPLQPNCVTLASIDRIAYVPSQCISK